MWLRASRPPAPELPLRLRLILYAISSAVVSATLWPVSAVCRMPRRRPRRARHFGETAVLGFDWSVFGLGALGAFAPEIVRLWELRSAPEKFRWSPLYLAASVLMCGLGGILALILAPDTAWKVFYAGLTAPVVIRSPGGVTRS